MIVRISGEGQYDLPDDAVKVLDDLDTRLTTAVHAGDEDAFHRALRETVQFVRESGTAVDAATVVPSQVTVPHDDATLDEARRFFTDEGLMEPLPA